MPGFRAMPTNWIYCSSQVKLTEDEIEAVSMLRVDNSASHACAGSHHAPDPRYLSPSSYATAVQSKRQRVQSLGQDSYVNCVYILGSAAEVARLWSLASYVLQDHRSSMTPMNLEALLFLKVNIEFWDVNTVDQACQDLQI